MDHEYGIAVTNKFALFTGKEGDPLKSSNKKKKGKSKLEESETKVAVPENEVPKKNEDKPVVKASDGGRGSAKNRESKDLREADGDKRPPRRQGPRDFKDGKHGDENVPPEKTESGGFRRREDREGGFGERGRGRGRGDRGRGRGGDRGGSSGGFGPRGDRKREFDRHSGTDRTGIKSVEKKDGGGAHNWGNFKDDLEEQGQVNLDESADAGSPQEKTVLNESGEVENPSEEEVQPQQMTLDEWKALRGQQKAKPGFNTRQAGEGVDSSQWKEGVEYQKKVESDHEEDENEHDHDHHHRSSNKQLVTDIRITFNDNPRRGRGRRGGRGGMDRGGRGGGMDRGGRGGGGGMDRGGRGGGGGMDRGSRGRGGATRGFGLKKDAAPRFDDADFPSLKTAA